MRSPDQLAAKILPGEWSLMLKSDRGRTAGFHWRHLAAALRAKPHVSLSELQAIALDYGLGAGQRGGAIRSRSGPSINCATAIWRAATCWTGWWRSPTGWS